jgi:hypothetical protein
MAAGPDPETVVGSAAAAAAVEAENETESGIGCAVVADIGVCAVVGDSERTAKCEPDR